MCVVKNKNLSESFMGSTRFNLNPKTLGGYKLMWRETAAQKRNIFYDDDDMMIFFIVEIWTSRASQLGTPFYQFDTRWSHYYDPFKKYV